MMSTPSLLSARASATVSSSVQPPSTQSVHESRTEKGRSSGHTRRMVRAISTVKRIRFSKRASIAVFPMIRERRVEAVTEIPMRGVQLDPREARVDRPPCGGFTPCEAAPRSPPPSARAAPASRSQTGWGSGPTGSQPPSSWGILRSGSHGRLRLALRPACASWIPGTAPCAATKRVIRASISTCAVVPDAEVMRADPAAAPRSRRLP